METRVDAHCHLWALERGDYGWLDPNDPELAPIARDFEMADLRATESTKVARIVVQAAPTVAETEYLLGLATAHDDIAGVVGWVDFTSSETASILAQLATHKAFKGLRPMLQDIPDVDWINTAPKPAVIAAMSDLNLTFDALVLPQHLDALHQFATTNPDLAIVIDHAAKPALAADGSDPRHKMWREGMARMATDTKAFCKVSGLLTELAAKQRPNAREVLQPVVDDLLDWFGPNRLMWGSDWPVLNLAASMGDWKDLSAELLSNLSPIDQAKIYGGTARDFYSMGESA